MWPCALDTVMHLRGSKHLESDILLTWGGGGGGDTPDIISTGATYTAENTAFHDPLCIITEFNICDCTARNEYLLC